MTLMAGFDLIVELSNETVLKLIRSTVTLEGQPLEPPFEISVAFSQTVSGTAHMVFTDVLLDLNDDDTLTLTLPFQFCTFTLGAPFNRALGPFAGQVRIVAAVGQSGGALTVDLAHATATLTPDAAGNTELDGDLAGSGIPRALFLSFVDQALTGRVQQMASMSLPLPFTVVPGVDGHLTPNLQVAALEVHCIGNADRKKQSLGLFGTLLAAHQGQGSHTQKTQSAISSSFDGMAISLSPSAFDALIFRPATQGINPGDGIHIDSITESFDNGLIRVHCKASKSGFCYDAEATVDGTLTLSASGTTITPNLQMGDPDVEVDIPWYCYLAVGVVLGPLAAGIVAIVDAALDGVSISLGDIGAGIGSINLGSLQGASFQAVDISPAGMTIQGRMSVPVSNPWKSSRLELDGSVVTLSSAEVSSGTFVGHTLCSSGNKVYEYTEYQQQQRAVLTLRSELTSQPLTPEIVVKIGGQSFPLSAATGTLQVPNVKTTYVMPAASGGSQVTQTVHLHYSLSGTELTLENTPSEGNYGVVVTATARDIDGDPITGLSGNALSAYTSFHFEGDRLDAPAWSADVQACMAQMREMVRRLAEKYKKKIPEEMIPPWVLVNYPAPERILDMLGRFTQIGIPEMDEVVVAARIAHGSSYTRAVHSQAATRSFSGKAAARREAAAIEAEVAKVRAALDALPAELGGAIAAAEAAARAQR